MTFKRDEIVTGKLACRPNGKNRRDLDIAIDYSFDGSQQTLDNIHTQYKMYILPLTNFRACISGLTPKGVGFNARPDFKVQVGRGW